MGIQSEAIIGIQPEEFAGYVLLHLKKKYQLDEFTSHRLLREFGFNQLVEDTNGKIMLYPPVYVADEVMEFNSGERKTIQDLLF